MKHSELKNQLLSNPETKLAYEALRPEFALLKQMLNARRSAGLSQSQVAEMMGTKAPAVTRLESSILTGKHSPSLATLRKYARAVGYELEVKLVKLGQAKQAQ